VIRRIYLWEVAVPPDRELNEALGAAQRAAQRVERFNPNVEAASVYAVDDKIAVEVEFTGHDQWWIKRKVVYAIAAVLAQSHIGREHARLVDVRRPPDPRSTRPRASDGRHSPLPDHIDIDHSDMGLVL